MLKYIKTLKQKNPRLWIAKTKLIPKITGAIGTISKSFRKYLSNTPEKHTKTYRELPFWALHAYFGKN
jgi:hypothetical protein